MNTQKGGNLTGIEYLLELNHVHSQEYQDPGTTLEREKYRANHPTEIFVMKCMDGRLHVPVMTKTALGIIQPWRNLGGEFDLGWGDYQKSVNASVRYAVNKGRDCLVLITDHSSKGDKHRGCKGFEYDENAAQASSRRLKSQFDEAYGKKVVYAVHCSIETDEDTLVFRSENNDFLDLAEALNFSEEKLAKRLRELYPDMPERILLDILPLCTGNIAHIQEIRNSHRPIAEAEHNEWVLAPGRGFDWLHEINTALIIGPFAPDLSKPIKTAAGLIKDNLERMSKANTDEGRLFVKRGIVLMTSAPYWEASGPERKLAELKSKFLTSYTMQTIKDNVSDLLPHLHILTTTVNMNNRALDVLYKSE